jgi:thiol:disulfide interchange protein
MRYFVALLFISFLSVGQNAPTGILKPTVWTQSVKPTTPKVGEEIDIVFSAKIQPGWKIYAAESDPDAGPMILEFAFSGIQDIQLLGKPKPTKPAKKFYEEVWEADVLVYSTEAVYIQKAKVTGVKPRLKANLTFQTCQDDGVCIPGDADFEIELMATAASVESKEGIPTSEVTISGDAPVQNADTSAQITSVDSVSEGSVTEVEVGSVPEVPVAPAAEGGMWKFLLVAFGAGFASIFMPCIYPIMPMTVSYFTKQKDGKFKAIFYGVSIMLIFAVMGLITMALGASFLNALSTHWLPNLIFFLLFVVFGFALLGAFEIVLPHGAVNKIDRLGDKGGLIGIFFMALTLVVVSFSCTVPFVGSLLIGAAGGEVLKPLYGMLAFGLPFALVFGGLAMFPQFLKSLPKSGGWLNELKAVFGFMEFALALKFLSNIDLAYHWNLIHRNVFLTLWILVAVIIGLYILGFIRMSKDEKVEKYGFMRVFFAAIFFGLAAYMLPGVTNKSLPALSGILPPLPTQASVAAAPKPDLMRALPHGLWGFNEIDDALVHAKETGKPVLIDFTGYACANCRKMEENVWSKPDILKSLSEDFVIASLYVDDKKELPKERQYVSEYDQKLKTTIGAKNLDFQMSKYNSNAQPYYIIVDEKGEMITPPVAYTSYEEFKNFLAKGKQN